MTRLWLVRHAPTHAKTMVGWSDIGADISDKQAFARLRDYLPQAPVVSSDLTRAVVTADQLHRPTRLDHDPALREIHFGDWELRSFSDIEAETPDLIRSFWETPGAVTAPGGENWDGFANRVTNGIDAHLRRGLPDLIVVAHFGAILTQVQRALGLTTTQAFAHKIDNLSVTDLRFSDGVWQVGRINHKL